MNDDMTDIEKILWIEKRFGAMIKSIPNPNSDKLLTIESELNSILGKAREFYKITGPLPKIRMWLQQDKLHFIFFDRKTGRRILLGDWLANKERYYEH